MGPAMVPPLPRIHAWTGGVACLGLATGFVLVCYCLPHSIRKLPRNDVSHILGRLLLVTIWTICVAPVVVAQLLQPGNVKAVLQWTGVYLPLDVAAPLSIATPVLHVMVLFLGPIYVAVRTVHQRAVSLSSRATMSDVLAELAGTPLHTTPRAMLLRNLVAAPILEELCFRAWLVPLAVASGWSRVAVLWCLPLFFGVAHVHHALDALWSGMDVAQVVVSTLFQLAYTTLFGAMTCYAFLCSGTVYGPILMHAFCNFMGFPSVAWYSDPHHPLAQAKLGCMVAFLVGIVGYFALGPLLCVPVSTSAYVGV